MHLDYAHFFKLGRGISMGGTQLAERRETPFSRTSRSKTIYIISFAGLDFVLFSLSFFATGGAEGGIYWSISLHFRLHPCFLFLGLLFISRHTGYVRLGLLHWNDTLLSSFFDGQPKPCGPLNRINEQENRKKAWKVPPRPAPCLAVQIFCLH